LVVGVSDSKGYINFFGEEFCYDHSPYVTQGNVFPKFYQDIQSHHVFCSLVDRKMAMENSKRHRKHYWGVELSDPCIEGYACSKNSEVSTVSLQFMQQMWDAYANRPKLAFLNAMAAHDYSQDWGMMIAKAEVYDDHIHNFLETMLSGTHRRHTMIIIRSDHGLQKGPLSMDFALQVEHRHPWTEVLVPESLVVSKSALFKNQDRMLTGYDLYQTMRLLMSDRTNGRNSEGGIPDWSFDILAEEISQNRTCEEAKVDTELCRKSGVKQTRQYGVCNVLDSSQVRFCSKGEAGS